MIHIKSIRNASGTHVWQMLSKSLTFSFEIFTRCEKFVRILHTCDKYEMGKKQFTSSLTRTVKTDVYMLIRIIAGHMCYGLTHMRAVIQFYWYLAFQLFIEIKSNKVICFEIKYLRLYTATKEVIIQAKSSKRFAGQWICTWRHSLATRKP